MTERERLIEIIGRKQDCGKKTIGLQAHIVFNNNLADFLLANGVIVPPCKIGGTLYDAGEFFLEGCSCPEIYELNDKEMTVCDRHGNLERRFIYDGMYIGHDDIGEHIFLTKEEAEKALSERSEGK